MLVDLLDGSAARIVDDDLYRVRAWWCIVGYGQVEHKCVGGLTEVDRLGLRSANQDIVLGVGADDVDLDRDFLAGQGSIHIHNHTK